MISPAAGPNRVYHHFISNPIFADRVSKQQVSLVPRPCPYGERVYNESTEPGDFPIQLIRKRIIRQLQILGSCRRILLLPLWEGNMMAGWSISWRRLRVNGRWGSTLLLVPAPTLAPPVSINSKRESPHLSHKVPNQ